MGIRLLHHHGGCRGRATDFHYYRIVYLSFIGVSVSGADFCCVSVGVNGMASMATTGSLQVKMVKKNAGNKGGMP
jgi:hypothetical protein